MGQNIAQNTTTSRLASYSCILKCHQQRLAFTLFTPQINSKPAKFAFVGRGDSVSPISLVNRFQTPSQTFSGFASPYLPHSVVLPPSTRQTVALPSANPQILLGLRAIRPYRFIASRTVLGLQTLSCVSELSSCAFEPTDASGS